MTTTIGWRDEYRDTLARAITCVGDNNPASQYLVAAAEEMIAGWIASAEARGEARGRKRREDMPYEDIPYFDPPTNTNEV